MSALDKVKSAAAEIKAGTMTSQTAEFNGLNHWDALGILALAIEEIAGPAPLEPVEKGAADAGDKALA